MSAVFEITSILRSQNKIEIDLCHKVGPSPTFIRSDLLILDQEVSWTPKIIDKKLNFNDKIHVDFDFSEFRHRRRICKFLKENADSLAALPFESECPIYIVVSSFSASEGLYKHRFPIMFHEKAYINWAEALFEFFDYNPNLQTVGGDEISGTPRVTPSPMNSSVQALPIAFYLPQFYPTPENDEWWGPGYTEWAGVVTNEARFESHVSPNIPADLGFYDTRVFETRRKQAELAKQYGIFGFCYYFYWFSGKRILEAPLEQMLRDGEPDLPFCLCWANETWSRRWDGSESEILIAQKHSVEKDLEILDDLIPYFENEKYIRIENKPLLLIYRLALMEQPGEYIRLLRSRAEEMGLPGLYLCSVMSFGHQDGRDYGCDASVEFPPHNVAATEIPVGELDPTSKFEGKIYDYRDLVSRSLMRPDRNFPYFPGVMPRWDNSARRGLKANVFAHASPEDFAVWLSDACERTERLNASAPFVFINSWNEWSEGAHLEPDRRYQRTYLEAVRIARAERRLISTEESHGTDDLIARQFRTISREVSMYRNDVYFSKIYSGYPRFLDRLSQLPGYKSHIDVVNGQQFTSNFVVDAEAGLHIKGWVLSQKDGELEDSFGLLILESLDDSTSYYIPVLDFQPRTDVASYYEISYKKGLFGFNVRTARFDLEAKVYKISFLQIQNGKVFHNNTQSIVHVF